MTDTTQDKPAVVKQEPNSATYTRTATVGATTVIGPQLVEPIIAYGFDIVHAFAAAFPIPSEGVLWSMATLACGGVATYLAYHVRGTRAERRSTDPADHTAG